MVYAAMESQEYAEGAFVAVSIVPSISNRFKTSEYVSLHTQRRTVAHVVGLLRIAKCPNLSVLGSKGDSAAR
jgi:hypothetical protein